MLKKFMTAIVVVGSLAAAGCNTVRGVGQDIQSVPDCIQGRTC